MFGGGRKGIMGVVSGAALEAGGKVTGIIPYAMIVAGGEKEAVTGQPLSKEAAEALFDGRNRPNVCACHVLTYCSYWTLTLTVILIVQEDTVSPIYDTCGRSEFRKGLCCRSSSTACMNVN